MPCVDCHLQLSEHNLLNLAVDMLKREQRIDIMDSHYIASPHRQPNMLTVLFSQRIDTLDVHS